MAVHFHPNIHWFSFIKNVFKSVPSYTHWPSFPYLWIKNSSQSIIKRSSHTFVASVGYTMADIRYKWNDGLNSVQVSGDVSLPQFKVLGHRQKTIEASLSTGEGYFVREWDIFTFSSQSESVCVCDSVIMGLTGYFITFNIWCLESGDCPGKHIPAVPFPTR